MALRLYRADSFLWQFAARVRERGLQDDHPTVILDQTAFYPTSGGQPFDTGRINGVPVLDVIESDDGEIIHVLQQAMLADEVRGEIDGDRRVDHMQQHSGQHVLSQAFVRVANLDTISVHLGNGDCTIDLPSSRLPSNAVERAEDEANQIIFENRPVIVREVTDAELPALPLRKPPKVSGLIRIVEMQGYDWSACGGTHVRSTGQIALLKITRVEKRAHATRVSFRCGRRALLDYRELNQVAAELVRSFSVNRLDLGQAVERLREENKAVRKELNDAQMRLMEYEAQELLQKAEQRGTLRVVVQAFAGRDANQLKVMAKRLTSEPGVVALLGTSGEPTFLCFARSGDVALDVVPLLRGALKVLSPESNARGGGTPGFAQGGGVPAGPAQSQAALNWAKAQAPI